MNNTAIFDGTADKWESLYDRCSMQTSHSLETCYWLFLAESRYSHCIKINVSYRETHASAAGWFEPITNVLNHSLFIVFNEIKNLFLNM